MKEYITYSIAGGKNHRNNVAIRILSFLGPRKCWKEENKWSNPGTFSFWLFKTLKSAHLPWTWRISWIILGHTGFLNFPAIFLILSDYVWDAALRSMSRPFGRIAHRRGPANHGRQHKPIKSSYKIKPSIPINVYIMSIDNDKPCFFCDAENGGWIGL